MAGDESSTEPHDVSERVHLPLLTLITQQALEEDYLVAAERRAAGARQPPHGRPRRVAALVIAAFGVLVATAFVQTARNADATDAGRASLIGRLENERDLLARQQQLAADLRATNLELEAELGELADTEQEALVRNRRLQVRTGFLQVIGQGVRITVTDRPDADPVQLVQAADLRLLVNGLFEAGAEAISVNGLRLTARSAISSSGPATEVNERGVTSPYVLEAVGDTRTLSGRLFDTTTGLAFVANAQRYGFTYTVANVAELNLPAGPPSHLSLRSASTEPLEPTGPLPGREDDAP